MRVDAHHLPEDLLADIEEVGWEAGALAGPVFRGRGGGCVWGGEGGVGEGYAGWVGGEDFAVVDFGTDVALD